MPERVTDHSAPRLLIYLGRLVVGAQQPFHTLIVDGLPVDSGRAHFADVLTCTLRRGGTVVIPAFAIDRTEVVLHELAELRRRGS
ncbi:hypothetical protein [Streptomyces sp. NPDC050528]|uniref:hypothetical protein n=1 Tax=Streptomyces sp. NPDC050528 TaxID=3365623 RepID=UPI0037BDC098